MVKQFFTALLVVLVITVAIGLGVGGLKLPSFAPSPSPTGSHPVPATPSAFPTSAPQPTPSASYVPPTPPPPFTISGRGPESSPPFDLPNADYQVAYAFPGHCQYLAALKSTDGAFSNEDLIANPRFGGPIAGPTSGLRQLHIQFPGSYLLAMSTGAGCAWSVTFTAQ